MRCRHLLVIAALVLAGLGLPVVSLPTSPARPVAPALQTIALAATHGSSSSSLDTGVLETRPFGLVGVSWSDAEGDAAADQLEVRVRRPDGWTGWAPLTATDIGPDADTTDGGARRRATEPLWVGEADAVRVRATSVDGRLPGDLRLDLVDPGRSAADDDAGGARLLGGSGAAADALAARPTVIGRSEWGADESLRCKAGPEYSKTIRAGFVHHTATANGYAREEVPAILRSIYAYHVTSNGWCDIAYNFLVDRFGRVWEGRFGGIERPVIGAHTGGFNTDTFGVSIIGTHETVAPTVETMDSVKAVLAWKLGSYYRDPMGTTSLTSRCETSCKYPAGTVVPTKVVSAHNDNTNTSCPGSAVISQMGQVRQGVVDRIGSIDTTIYRRWKALGGETGPLGAPSIGEQAVPGGDRTVFQSMAIYASPRTPANLVLGAILTNFQKVGETASALGFPTTDEGPSAAGGRHNFFEGGAIFWKPSTGAHEVHGGIYARWSELQREHGLGYPTSDERYGSGTAWNEFERGNVYWSAATGAHDVWGGIRERYLQMGGPASALRQPITGEAEAGGKGAYSLFVGGAIFWRSDLGAHAVQGGIFARWTELNREWGLGYPTGNEQYLPGGAYSAFERGRIYWSPRGGAHDVSGPILEKYLALGGPASCLGYPTANEADAPGGRVSTFEHGRIFRDSASGQTTATCDPPTP